MRLIAPHYVKPFVKTNKNDAADAEAICEAALRPTMRFAPVESADQQAVLLMQRAQGLLVRQRTQLINALRGHCAEFGLVAAKGACNVSRLIVMIEDRSDERIPDLARETIVLLVEQLRAVQSRIGILEKRLKTCHACNKAAQISPQTSLGAYDDSVDFANCVNASSDAFSWSVQSCFQANSTSP